MSESKPRIIDVVDTDMCIACGACIYACPHGVVVPSYRKSRGAHEIHVTRHDTCVCCAAPCEVVCPSLEVNFREFCISGHVKEKVVATHHGSVLAVRVGYSSRFQADGVSSSGGLIRALIADAIERGQPVICLGGLDGTYEAMIVESLGDLQKVPGSIYHGVSFCKCIALLKAVGRSCVIVSTPCQLEGITKYIRHIEPDLDAKIALKIGLICGWMYSDHAIHAFAHYKGIRGKILDVTYRGEGKVGFLRIRDEHKEYKYSRREFPSLRDAVDYSASFSRYANRLRCRVCEDHVNVLADIAVGDAWLQRCSAEKVSLVVTRTIRGEKRLNSLLERSEIVVRPGRLEDLEESQSANLVHGYSARRFQLYLEARKTVVPKFGFDDGIGKGRIRLTDQVEFAVEMIMRWALRRASYRLYRILYLVTTLRRQLRWAFYR